MTMTDEAPDTLPATTGDTVPDGGGRVAEIEELMADTRGEYWQGPKSGALQREYRELIDRQGGNDPSETDEGLARVAGVETPALADTMSALGLSEDAARGAINAAMNIASLVPEEDRAFFDASLGGLADETRGAIIRELASPAPDHAEPASQDVLDTLAAHGVGELLREWGIGAARRVGIANDRVNRMRDSLESDEAAEDFVVWFNGLSGPELSAILRVIA